MKRGVPVPRFQCLAMPLGPPRGIFVPVNDVWAGPGAGGLVRRHKFRNSILMG